MPLFYPPQPFGQAIDYDEIADTTLVIESEGIASNDNDNTVATCAAIIDYTTGFGYITAVVDDTTPQLGGMLDVNGNAIGDGTFELLSFTEVALAINHLNITNAAIGDGPILSAVGDDTDIDIRLAPKGLGHVDYPKTLPATAGQTLVGLNLVVDSSAQAATSIFHALNVQTTGTPAGEVAAVGTVGKVKPVHQHVTTLAQPSQTEFAGLKSGGGVTWADGLDGIEIFVADDDAIFVGGVSPFDEIEVVFGTEATKDARPTFWYNTAADAWTEFFPLDGTEGFTQSGVVTWSLASITASWTGDGDPGAGDTTAGYWIKIVRTRVADPGSPTPTTIKIGAATEYEWDGAGALAVKSLTLGTTTLVSSILDEDAMGSDSAVALATQQSIKKYVDTRIRYVQVIPFDFTTDCATGDGKFYVPIPAELDGYNLVSVHAEVITAGTTGTMSIQVHNVDNALDMLSTLLTVDTGVTGSNDSTPAVINESNDHVNTYDVLRIDFDGVHTTPAKGSIITLGLQLP